MKQKKGFIVIISGPSGVGKRTIIEQFINNKDLNLSYSISMTTRKKRHNEIDGKDYFFVSEQDFQKNIDDDNFIEWAEFAGNKYGTLKSYVKNLLDNNKNVILEIEVQGARQVIKKLENENYLSIFICPPSIEELKRRLLNRKTESIELIELRLKKANEEIKLKDEYHYTVVNDISSRAVMEIENIIRRKINEN